MSEYEIYNEDCLVGMKRIVNNSVDCIITDLPFGITSAPFDVRLPFDEMWAEFRRVTKKNAAIVLFSNGKFLIELAASNLKMYRYKWTWQKNLGTGFLNAKKMPLKCHEDILIFYDNLPTFNPQFTNGKPYNKFIKKQTSSVNYREHIDMHYANDGRRYPTDVLKFPVENGRVTRFVDSHPQQKPVDLLEYLIRTYTNEGELVLDATMGSGSTGAAAINQNRRFIGFETEEKFFEIAKKRIDEAIAKREQSLFKLEA